MTAPTAEDFIGRTVVDQDGSKIGKVGQVYLNDRSGQPEWVTVKSGLFGSGETFVPLNGADLTGENIVTTVSKDIVKGAPHVDPDGHTNDDEQNALYEYYAKHLNQNTRASEPAQSDRPVQSAGSAGPVEPSSGQRRDRAGDPSIQGADTSGPTTDDAMTRSEERLHVGTEQVQSGRAKLRKYIVTENVTQTVPVSHEEVRVVREPINDASRHDAMSGNDITEEEHEVTLHSERAVVSKEAVPVERVRLGTETVTEQHEVNETVRKEQIDSRDVQTPDDNR